ncbi:tetratricopeptide repeat protein [Neisseria dumasiana]|uniref:tetratricopeptide repeat protein n=1 Tax=Neisseria dumasiana TaxID=1931275 RepID=UPI000A19A04C|nr:SEL1-like repeat protein [Neisseria dumasiana]OSI15773.1 hypothetical protein BV914_06345 [Neisseria dumasiana]
MIKNNIILMILSLELFGCGYFDKQVSDTKLNCAIDVSEQAVKQLIQCAQIGDAVSQYNLGVKYREGIDVQQDFEQGFHWTQRAAAQGLAEAEANLSWFYETGLGVPKNPEQAFLWAEKAAKKKIPLAINNLGSYYQKGFGTAVNLEKGAAYFRQAAEEGNLSLAQVNLGFAYFYGNGVPQNTERALFWTKKAAEQGDSQAMANLGKFYKELGQLNEAFMWTEKAAATGNPLAEANLGFMYAHGVGVNTDKDKAWFWLDKSMKQNNSYAFFLMGTLHSQSNPTFPYDEAKAYKYYQQAAEMGNANAQNNLANWLMNGRYIPKNETEALKWYEKAAENGLPIAIRTLIKIYGEGSKDIPKDEAKKQHWQNKLSEQ